MRTCRSALLISILIPAGGVLAQPGVLWDTGGWDGRDGELSWDGPPFARSADDFVLGDAGGTGAAYRVTELGGWLLRAGSFPEPTSPRGFTIFSDQGGVPGSEIATISAQVTSTEPALGGTGLILERVVASDVDVLLDPSQRYWLSLFSSGTNDPFFATGGGSAIQGLQGHVRSPALSLLDWTPTDALPIGATDFAFSVIGEQVPSPAGFVVAGSALGLVGLRRRR